MITEDLVRKKILANKKRCTNSSVSAEKDNENWLIYQINTGVHNVILNDHILTRELTHFPTNGRREKVSDANRSITSSNINDTEDQSLVIYNHLGNLVTKT